MKNPIRFLFVFLFVLFCGISQTSHAGVWTARNSWSERYEILYRQWIRENLTTTFFSQQNNVDGTVNPFYGLRPDCADTVYSMRVIFAWRHSLPIAFRDPTGGSQLITNDMNRWNNVTDESQRVRRFLNYIYGTMSTHSLPEDTYPVAISTVGSGTIIATTDRNHHSWTIKEFSDHGVPWLVYNSTVGTTGDLVLFERKSWPNANWVFEGNFTPSGDAGFRFWRPANYLNRDVEDVPGYSEEQYQIPLARWTRTVQRTLARLQETARQRLERFQNVACQMLRERIELVSRATDEQGRQGQACWNYATYDIHSTPNRDRTWMIALLNLRLAYQEWKDSSEYQAADPIVRQLDKVFPNMNLSAEAESSRMRATAINEDSLCTVEYLPGQQMDLAEAKRRLFAGLISNNPLDVADVRWGNRTRSSSDQASRCQSWDPWVPNFNEDLE